MRSVRTAATSAAVAGWALLWFVPAFSRSGGAHPTGEWLFFKVGALALLGDQQMASHPLRLYAENPGLQIGPPALLLVALLTTLSSPAVSTVFFPVAMSAAGSWLAVATALPRVGLRRPSRLVWLCAVAVVIAVWARQTAVWRHLDDALVVGCAAAALLCLRRDRGQLAAVLLGVACAAKPWAVVLVPVLLALPRRRRPAAALTCIATAGVFWLPFVLVAPDTLGALGGFHLTTDAGSVPHLLGLRGDQAGWLRSAQFVLGSAVCAWCTTRGRASVEAAALAAIAAKSLLDPYFYGYYGLTPLVLALLVDVRERARLPMRTLLVLLGFFAVSLQAAPAVGAAARLLLCGLLVLSAARGRASVQTPTDASAGLGPPQRSADVAPPGLVLEPGR